MERKKWIRLDNASNIFLAAKNAIDTKVFRLSAELDQNVNPRILQRALNLVYDQYALYHSVLRRGLFWYYLEESDLRPVVRPETGPPCSPIYHFDRKELLFRVLYHENRVHLEVFHALSDGTGALWFFEDLISEYIALQYLEPETTEKESEQKRGADQSEDSFARYFRKSRQKNFAKAALSALEKIYLDREKDSSIEVNIQEASENERTRELKTDEKPHVYRIRGNRTPDNRMRVIELELTLKKVLSLAKLHQVSLTVYLIALYILAVYQTKEKSSSQTTITISVPVNLRQFFPSQSARNFFTTTHLAITFNEGAEPDLLEICKDLSNQLKEQTNPEYLEEKVNRFISFELNPFIRVTFRPLKDLILKLINLSNNRNVTVAMSNLGKASFPNEVKPYIQGVYFHTSAIRPQFCMISHENSLTLSFTTPFVETVIQRRFIELLTEQSIDVVVGTNRVTKEELEGWTE
ncbi:hypothetical protein [Marinilactibacillus piezotolerans]|uniref:hypothetical protein n=1 Tax=Marinilactibacillus piezotolerans TaxID=258723 RepID=UPI0009B11104|nr:hypothetical protein [Marinilactibacillus piezotolerans]